MMVHRILFVIALFTLARSTNVSFAASVDQRADGRNNPLDSAFRLVRESIEEDEVPGAIALVARGGTILRHEALGWSDPMNCMPFTTNTLC